MRGVILRHILRNAAIPIVTVIGLQLGLLLSGAVLTETIYSLPGLGRLMVDSILSRDYPVVQAGALFIAVLFVLVNLAVDILYAALDPRISRCMSATVASPPGVIRRALRGTGARFGLAIAVVFLALTVFAPLVAPFDPYEQDLSNALSPPSALHWFGADQYGRDTLSRILYGTRTALLAIVMADGLALLLGGSLGLVAGYARRTGGRADHAPGRCAAGVSLSAAGADHRGGARPQPDQFGDRDRHHLYAAICQADARPGAVGAGGRFRRGGALDRRRAPARDAAPCAAEQLYPGAGAGHAAVGRGGGGDGGTVVPRPRRAAAVARLGRAARGRARLFPDGVVDRDVSRAGDLPGGGRLQPAGRRAARPVRSAAAGT